MFMEKKYKQVQFYEDLYSMTSIWIDETMYQRSRKREQPNDEWSLYIHYDQGSRQKYYGMFYEAN